MAERLKVNPTRMELRRLKNRLKTAERGHKLLKDKSDEMIRRFMEYVRENKRLREEIEDELSSAMNAFMIAKAVTDENLIKEAVMMPASSLELDVSTGNVMSVAVPKMQLKESGGEDKYAYSFISVTSELDESISTLTKLSAKLINLADIEKTCNMLADEIEKNRRRVNALEYVMIPETIETIKFITMKLDENERGNIVRLMKVKSMMESK